MLSSYLSLVNSWISLDSEFRIASRTCIQITKSKNLLISVGHVATLKSVAADRLVVLGSANIGVYCFCSECVGKL